MTTKKDLMKLKNLVEKTKKEGAKVLLGGKNLQGLIKVFIMNRQFLMM